MDLLENGLQKLRVKVETANRDFEAAIKAENIEKVLELISVRHDVDISKPICNAFTIGNVEIIELLIKSQGDVRAITGIHPMVFVAYQNYDEAKKIKILEFLVPYIFPPYEYPMFPAPQAYFGLLLDSCYSDNIFLLKFFIHKYYTEKNNTLYPLIKKLEAVVDNPYLLCIILHDDIDGYDQICTVYDFDCGPLIDIFTNLLVKNTPLAVEVAQALIERNYTPQYYSLTSLNAFDQLKLFLTLTPLPTKCIFQFLYCLWDPKIENAMHRIIVDWLDLCSSNYEMFEQLWRCVLPLFLNPKHIDSATAYFDEFEELKRIMTKGKNATSLKEICRNVASSKIAEAVKFNPRDFFQRVWSLNIPETLKCYLLRIPDASWMNDLPTL